MSQSTGAFRILLISCFTLYFFGKADCSSVVNVGETQIVGQTVYAGERIVNQFLAVPYAEAPTGSLRFKKPVPRRYLPDLYYAFNQPPACWQKSMYPFPWYDASPYKDEDCLYLNIWVPEHASSTNKKAVIYFIHGGGFRFGSIRQSDYNAAGLAAHGDVVVVTVNYRVGSFGFLTSGTEDAPGNIGLYDILEGLKWVNKNIEAFGGDSSRITLAGQGAGSTAAGILTTSPLAEGLFQRVIMESGSPAYPDKDSIKTNLDISQKVAERLYCANRTHTIQTNPDEVLKCLRSVSPQMLTDVTASMHPLSSELYIPQFGGELLPQDPLKAIQKENFTCTDLLIGNTRDEGSYILTTQYPTVYGFFGALVPSINKTLGKRQIKGILSEFNDRNAIAQHYLPESLPENEDGTVRTQVYTALGDATVVCPEMFYAEQCAKMGGDVYYYIWNHRPTNSVWFPWMGVAHGTEVEFVFGLPLLHPYTFLPDEATLSKNIIDIWASFARDGRPNILWPEYSKQNPRVKVLGAGANQQTDQNGFHQENCNFFRSYFGFE
ncbi:acetylcholinesterase-1-like isoform X2 [Argiope bruennichi]|uniref:acetylcholinesterase n=1 Tax=Argiope bruennichi TaxID=94029 RepID=A0A8T0EFR7_ARGBR|nr:acetylcholinesterase-1-like isoform X1 [Argiope bruennichi]XP_055953153.1 acetylcholinesterase-1-like isoform X2 [Argiope bruennichi]KAF8770247.1 Acetylcholinesterase-1 like protein [Argiope bruennichi]KAF8770248.1 Acetylcholinesterase-1 like protein [Argiope bruennichi]